MLFKANGFLRAKSKTGINNATADEMRILVKLLDLDWQVVFPESDGSSLRDTVIRRAAELRREWGWDPVAPVAGG